MSLNENSLTELKDVITNLPDEAEEIIEKFRHAINGLNSFYNHETKAGAKFLYQYDPANQKEFSVNAGEINRSLSAIEVVLMDKYQKLTQMDTMVSAPDTPETPIQIDPTTPPKPTITEKIFGKRQKKKGGVHSAFAIELSAVDEIKNFRKSWYGHIDYHSYMCELSEEEPVTTMRLHLSPEKTEFNMRVSRIETVFEQKMALELRYATESAMRILTAQVKLDQQMELRQ